MAHEYTLFSRLRTTDRMHCFHRVRARVRRREKFHSRARARACTQRLQLVAKVRASPNNGFPHEEQIGGAIYLSGALAYLCILTREQALRYLICVHTITRAHVHTHELCGAMGCVPVAISMRNKKKTTRRRSCI